MILRGFWAVFLLGLCTFAHGAETLETFQVNLDSLIDKAMRHRTQFAVNVSHHVDSESTGKWRIESGDATWDYAIHIPTAVSLGFHASRLTLPALGTLTITGGGQSFTYKSSDLRRADFWSRTVKGDQVAIRITVPKQMRHQALIEIAAFQAGYRSLAPGMPDNPHYTSLKARGADSSGSCVQNYVCDATPGTQISANASAAIVISNQFECSATLLNDVPQDGVPYLLTARHCENGEDGGGDPAAAASVQVYWNSVTACGQTLQSIFDSYSQVESGGTTIVEQQDEWLIRLDGQPAWSSVYYAGWDASGSSLVDGYSVEYSNADTQQYVTWDGPAITQNLSAQTLGVGYASTYWGVVNSLGSVDHGASGSGLFNKSNLVVGSASRAVVEQCPASPPPAPSPNTVVALYNQLASTWNSTADASSSTGSTTIASVLDPAHTGATVMAGIAGPPATAAISASQSSSQTGNSVELQFEGSASAVCTATGGAPGDGWSGTLNAYPEGNVSLTETTAGSVTYGIKCVSGTRSSSAQVTVTWSLAVPTLTFYDQVFPNGLYAGLVNPLIWQSTQASCTATGGAPGDGWAGAHAGSGQVDVTENAAGTYVYSLTCGTGDQSVSRSLSLTFAAPTASLSVSGMPGLRFGQSIALGWNGSGDCTASGGASGDGWAGPLTGNFGAVFLTEQTAGSYVYTISCGPTAVAAVVQATYTFTGNAPTAQLTASQPTQLIDLSVETYPGLLNWTSNVQPCAIDYTGPVSGSDLSGYPSQGTDTEPQEIAGVYSYVLTCGLGTAQAQSTASIQWTQQPVPQVTLTAENGIDEPGNEFLLSTGGYLKWTTNVLPCIGSGGTPGDAWDLTLPYYGGPGNSSALLFSEPKAGTYTFTITCGVGDVATAQATAIYNNAGGNVLTLAPGSSQVDTGQPTYMSWNSTVGPCTASGGTNGDGWNGSQPQVGTAAVIESPGDYTLSLVCGTGSVGVEAQSEIYVGGPATSVYVILVSNLPNLNTVEVGHPVTLQWTGNGAISCTATGGVAGDGWKGTLPWNGKMTVVEAQADSVPYGLSCRNGALSGQDAVTIMWEAAPSVSLSASTEQAVLGTPFTLTWSSANGADDCTASEDGTGTWSGSVASAGSMSIEETSGSQHTYTILCSSSFGSVKAQVVVKFSPTTSGGTGTSTASTPSGGSGGGSMDGATIGMLGVLAAMRLYTSRTRRRRRRSS
jgi:hypothetical protein